MSTQLIDEVRRLLTDAEAAYGAAAEPQAQTELQGALARLDGPLLVAIAGKVKAGKSTLLNALVRERLAPTDAGECTQLVSMYRHGQSYGVQAIRHGDQPIHLRFARDTGALEIDLGTTPVADIERLVIDWPSASLEKLTLVDTPGIASISLDASLRAVQYLAPDDERATEADAVLYLMRHLHAADRKFLESFHDQQLSQASPVNTIAVLSRADEIGVGRLDAMASARKIATRYRTDPQLRRLCQTVIPVAGLIAEAAATLRQDEFQAFATLAGADRQRVDALLLSVDRFASSDDGCGLLDIEREHLLLRFGLYGVRLSVALLRQSVATSAAELSAELSKRSGVDELRQVLDTTFGERRAVLKARAGLLTVRSIIDRFGDPNGAIAAGLERIWANAHEVAELRLLNGLRSGQVTFGGDTDQTIELAIGAAGSTPARRLGMSPESSVIALRDHALARLSEWRTARSHPLTTRDQQDALDVAIRSIEQVVHESTAGA